MFVQMTKQGLFVISAENDKENAKLFEFINEAKKKRTIVRFGSLSDLKSEETETPVAKVTPKKYYQKKDNKTPLNCVVEGCTYVGTERTMGGHLYRAHGIRVDGSLDEKVSSPRPNNPKRKITPPKPVVKLPNGTYKLVPKKPTENTFSRGLLDY